MVISAIVNDNAIACFFFSQVKINSLLGSNISLQECLLVTENAQHLKAWFLTSGPCGVLQMYKS